MGNDLLDEQALRQEIVEVGASLYRRGYTVGFAGNISSKLKDGWLITPTDACLGKLKAGSISKISLTGEWISGERPSKTLTLHLLVYERNNNVGGIVHTHSTNLVALTLKGVWTTDSILPPITPYQVMKVGKVPLISYMRPGHPQVASLVAELATSVKAVMLERLGPVAWAGTVSQASAVLEELEETAKLWLMTGRTPIPLTAHEIEDIERNFNGRW